MILHEVLNLYPLGPVNGRRITAAETKLGNLSLPSGMVILLQLQTLIAHHDPEIWGEDAKEFKPEERFCQGVSHATKGNIAFFPFGWDLLLAQMRGMYACDEKHEVGFKS